MRGALLCACLIASAGALAAQAGSADAHAPAEAPHRQAEPDAPAEASAERALRALYAASRERLRDSPFRRPLFLDSVEREGRLKGDVFALVDHPLAAVAAAFARPAHWCETLLLNPNVGQCAADEGGAGAALAVGLLSRFDQPPAEAHPARFVFDAEPATGDYFAASLRAREGPVGTRDYSILLQAVPVDEGRTFLHLRYSYAYGLAARLTLSAYLMTSGRDKVGFTRIGTDAEGRARYVDGLRGAVERNAMRHFLAIEAFLAASGAPPQARFERSLELWLGAIERYPRQLQEENRAAYLAAKRQQHRAQVASR